MWVEANWGIGAIATASRRGGGRQSLPEWLDAAHSAVNQTKPGGEGGTQYLVSRGIERFLTSGQAVPQGQRVTGLFEG